MGYIEDLREIVGNRPLLLTGAGVGVFNEKGEILLQQKFGWTLGDTGRIYGAGESAEETGSEGSA